jgi:rubrerythrin
MHPMDRGKIRSKPESPYRCRECDFLLSAMAYRLAEHDYSCPSCNRSKLSEFKRCEEIGNE